MNLPDFLLGEVWYQVAWAAWLPLFARSVLRTPWRLLAGSDSLNAWMGAVVFLTLIWSMQAGVKPGLSLHLLGAAVMTLCFGPAMAFLGLNGALLGVTLNGSAGWQGFAMNALLMAGVGVGVSRLVSHAVSVFLPRHFFIYIFCNSFFGAGLAVVMVGAVSSVVFALDGVYAMDYLFGEYLPYFLLLGFSESWLSGMVMTLCVIYRPSWVQSFDDASYLANK